MLIVQASTLSPGESELTEDEGLCGAAMKAPPLNTVQLAIPMVGCMADRVPLLPHTLWLLPAFATGGG